MSFWVQPDAGTYLSELAELVSGDPATQAEIFADSQSAAMLTPDPSTRLRYALVSRRPATRNQMMRKRSDCCRELLSQPEMMTSSEIALATIFAERCRDSTGARLRVTTPAGLKITVPQRPKKPPSPSECHGSRRRIADSARRWPMPSPNSRPSPPLNDRFASNPKKTIRNSSHRTFRCRLR